MVCCCCFDDDYNEYITCRNNHIICKDCVIRGVSVSIGDNNFFRCPDTSNCKIVIDESQINKIVNATLRLGYQNVTIYNNISNIENICYCENCSFAAVIDEGQKKFVCINCKEMYCTICKKRPHDGKPCYPELYQEAESYTNSYVIRCCVPLVKYDACNHLTCSRCGTSWCWYCKRLYSQCNKTCPPYSEQPIQDAQTTSHTISEKLSERMTTEQMRKNSKISYNILSNQARQILDRMEKINKEILDIKYRISKIDKLIYGIDNKLEILDDTCTIRMCDFYKEILVERYQIINYKKHLLKIDNAINYEKDLYHKNRIITEQLYEKETNANNSTIPIKLDIFGKKKKFKYSKKILQNKTNINNVETIQQNLYKYNDDKLDISIVDTSNFGKSKNVNTSNFGKSKNQNILYV